MQAAPTPTTLGDALQGVMANLRRTVSRRVRGDLPAPQLSPSQIEVLRTVRTRPGVGVRDLADTLHLAQNTVSAIVARLVDGGLVRRDADPDDARAVCIRLTPTGYRRARTWRDRSAQALDDALGTLSATERANLALALPALEHLVDALSTDATR